MSGRKAGLPVRIMLFTVLFMMFASSVSASITITSVTIPSSAMEGETVDMSFTASTNEFDPISYYIFIDGEMVSDTGSYQWQTGYTDSGIYDVLFQANTTNSSAVEQRSLEIEDNPLSISVESPEEEVYGTPSISILAVSEQASQCDYEINDSTSGTLNKEGNEFSGDTELAEGYYEISINCSNEADHEVESVFFSVDFTGPEITDSEPHNTYSSPISGSTVTMYVETDEPATCRYSQSDLSYSLMGSPFANTGTIEHYQLLTGLAEGSHTYYVSCIDLAGNEVDEREEISFYTDSGPTAIVKIEKDDPLKAGTYKVELTTSEDLQSEPLLRYNFYDDTTYRTISLTGSGSEWSGYMIIEDDQGESIGTFHFSGTDLMGLGGSQITSGKIFLVDTVAPSSVSSLEVVQEGSLLKLEWYYPDEDFKRFRIYRSTESGPSYTDLLGTTTSTVYKDLTAEEGVTYYYKVAVEDDAENTGALSSQVSGRVEPELTEASELAPTLAAKTDQKIIEVQSYILDAEWAHRNLESETRPDESEAIKKLSLVANANSLISSLNSLKTDLEKLKLQDLDETEFNKRLSKISASLDGYKNSLVRSVEIEDKVEYQQHYDEADFQEELTSYFSYKNFDITPELISLNKDMQASITINGKVLVADIEYMYGNKQESKTIITKTITSSESLNDVVVVENIPKNVEDNADDIVFNTKPAIIRKDPLVEWSFSTLNSHEIFYIIPNGVELSDARSAVTSVFRKASPAPQEAQPASDEEPAADNDITGMVSDNGEATLGGWSLAFFILGVFVVIGLLVYYFFFIRDDSVEEVESPTIVRHRLEPPAPFVSSMPRQKPERAVFRPDISDSVVGSLAGLIVLANQKADELQFATVHKLYMSMIHLYPAVNFTDHYQEARFRSDVSKVYSKLVLFLKLKEADKCLSGNDLKGMQKNLGAAKSLLDIHSEDDSYFISYAKKVFDHLQVSAIGLGR